MTAIDFGENMGFRSSMVPMSISLALGKEPYARLSLSTDSTHPFVHGLLMLVGTSGASCIFKTFGNGYYVVRVLSAASKSVLIYHSRRKQKCQKK